MSRTQRAFNIQKRKDSNTYLLTLNPPSGLPEAVCGEWRRKSFSHLPPPLAVFRNPKNKAEAEKGAMELVNYLRNQPGVVSACTGNAKVGQAHCLAFMSRLGQFEKDVRRGGGGLAGTRTFVVVVRFVRMAFKEYGMTHEAWRNPFDRIWPPKSKEPLPRDILEPWEVRKLFEPGVISDPLERALAAAMLWAGMRKSEILGLRPEDLNWDIPHITVRNAWKCHNTKNKRLGDPKWHKVRIIPFPEQLQNAIKELWDEYGRHDFVFCGKKGKLAGGKRMQNGLKKWIKAAGIDLKGRNIVPHGRFFFVLPPNRVKPHLSAVFLAPRRRQSPPSNPRDNTYCTCYH